MIVGPQTIGLETRAVGDGWRSIRLRIVWSDSKNFPGQFSQTAHSTLYHLDL